MEKMIYILLGTLLLLSANSAQSATPVKTKVSSDKINTLKTRCTKDQSNNACYELGQKYVQQQKPVPALYYWRNSLIILYKMQDNERNKKTRKLIENKINNLFEINNNKYSRQQKMCLCLQMLPWTLSSNIISNKNNTIDQNLEAIIGNFKSILVNSSVGLGLQVDYSFQTFTNSIGRLFNSGNDGHILTLMYLLGQAFRPKDIQEGMAFMIEDASYWSFTKNMFGHRTPMAQYGIALELIDLIKKNQIKNPLLKKIVTQFLQGNTAAAAKLLLSDQQVIFQALDMYKKIRIDSCQLPEKLL